MKKPIKIAIAEDHELVRQGIVSLLNEEPDLKVVLEAGDGAELLRGLKKRKVDIILLDLEMPIVNGHQAMKLINERYPEIDVIILSMHYSDEFISDSIALGARGILPKNCDIEKVVDAIFAVLEDGYYFDDKISKAMLKRLINGDTSVPVVGEPLTDREIQVIELICSGKQNKDIADLLCISVRTVESHRKKIFHKTKVTNIAQLVVFAIRHGYYKIQI